MRRLSDLVTTLVDKDEVQARDVSVSDDVDAEGSRKRKRSPSPSPSSQAFTSQSEVELKLRVEQLEQELTRLQSLPQSRSTSVLPLVERSQELTRPVKRMGTERREGGIGRSVATAAGYTTLGAALAWAALAYAL